MSNGDDNFARGPWVLENKDTFENFYKRFIDIHSTSSTWLWVETTRELNYCQDYFLSLYGYITKNANVDFDQLSNGVRQDFIDMAETLRKSSMNFLTDEMPKLNFDDLNKWHKYKKNVTVKRLGDSNLGKKYLTATQK